MPTVHKYESDLQYSDKTGADSGRQFLEALAAGLWALPPLRSALAEANPAALSGKPGGHAAMALRSLFAALSAQQQGGGGNVGASVAAVPEHVRNALWRDFSAAGGVSVCIFCRNEAGFCA